MVGRLFCLVLAVVCVQAADLVTERRHHRRHHAGRHHADGQQPGLGFEHTLSDVYFVKYNPTTKKPGYVCLSEPIAKTDMASVKGALPGVTSSLYGGEELWDLQVDQDADVWKFALPLYGQEEEEGAVVEEGGEAAEEEDDEVQREPPSTYSAGEDIPSGCASYGTLLSLVAPIFTSHVDKHQLLIQAHRQLLTALKKALADPKVAEGQIEVDGWKYIPLSQLLDHYNTWAKTQNDGLFVLTASPVADGFGWYVSVDSGFLECQTRSNFAVPLADIFSPREKYDVAGLIRLKDHVAGEPDPYWQRARTLVGVWVGDVTTLDAALGAALDHGLLKSVLTLFVADMPAWIDELDSQTPSEEWFDFVAKTPVNDLIHTLPQPQREALVKALAPGSPALGKWEQHVKALLCTAHGPWKALTDAECATAVEQAAILLDQHLRPHAISRYPSDVAGSFGEAVKYDEYADQFSIVDAVQRPIYNDVPYVVLESASKNQLNFLFAPCGDASTPVIAWGGAPVTGLDATIATALTDLSSFQAPK